MTRPLYLFVGPSGAGKTTISEAFADKYGLKTVQSYTTRTPRYDGEVGHTFITDKQFDELQNIVSYTLYNGFRYCTTKDMLDDSDIFVVDIDGVDTLLDGYVTKRPICICYLKSTVATRIKRMLDRGDCDTAIIGRLINDEQYDWEKKLVQLAYCRYAYKHDIYFYKIDANKTKDQVMLALDEVREDTIYDYWH